MGFYGDTIRLMGGWGGVSIGVELGILETYTMYYFH